MYSKEIWDEIIRLHLEEAGLTKVFMKNLARLHIQSVTMFVAFSEKPRIMKLKLSSSAIWRRSDAFARSLLKPKRRMIS